MIWSSFVLCHAASAAEPRSGQQFDVYLPHPSGIGIHDEKAGVVHLEDGEPSYVSTEAYRIDIVGEAMCQWHQDIEYPCTWYGYQFDISSVQAETLIVCDVTNSIRTTFGPKTDEVTGSHTARYTIKLEPGQDHLFHAAYHTYAPVAEETAVISIHACSIEGVPLYRASFQAFYEPEDEAGPP